MLEAHQCKNTFLKHTVCPNAYNFKTSGFCQKPKNCSFLRIKLYRNIEIGFWKMPNAQLTRWTIQTSICRNRRLKKRCSEFHCRMPLCIPITKKPHFLSNSDKSTNKSHFADFKRVGPWLGFSKFGIKSVVSETSNREGFY